jgi:hypothetical protein
MRACDGNQGWRNERVGVSDIAFQLGKLFDTIPIEVDAV